MLVALILPLVAVFILAEESHSSPIQLFKCSIPALNSQNINFEKFKADFNGTVEVRFQGIIGPFNERQLCKIKCIDGQWVGPLCSPNADGRYKPILRECPFDQDKAQLILYYDSVLTKTALSFPHGSNVTVRCKQFGLYKMKGENQLTCDNGDWVPKIPECVPTAILNEADHAPPSIYYTTVDGAAYVEPSGELLVYPDSTIRLDCVLRPDQGTPEWSWTQAIGQYKTEWITEEPKREHRYRLTLTKMSARNTDLYTCSSSNGSTNTVAVKVVSVSCSTISVMLPVRQYTQGHRAGDNVIFNCPEGYHINGSSVCTCMGTGHWSCDPPNCAETLCPVLKSLGPHLNVVEYNSSFGGRAIFQCSWGYRLVGAPGLECEQDGTWSGELPHCSPIYCPNPVVPERGRLLTDTSLKEGKYPVGDLIIYACDEGYEIVGESSIVCTENGFWSHPPPFCTPPSEIQKEDTIFIDNTTLVHVAD